MAKRKGQRKQQQKPPKPQETTKADLSTTPRWGIPRRALWVFGKTWLLLSLIAVLVGLYQAWPSLSVEEGARVDERNPYSTLFSVANEGYLPVTDLDVICHANFSVGRGTAQDNDFAWNQFAKILRHSEKSTIPCFKIVGFGPNGSPPFSTVGDLTATVSYSPWPLKIRWMRRTQEFHFKAFQGPDGHFVWTYVN
jgi:hypothetical protein